MKRISFLPHALTGAMLLGSCGQKQEAPSANEQDTTQVSISDTATVATSDTQNSQTVNEIRKFVYDTYTEVFSAYTQEHIKGGNGPDRSVFDKKFLSQRLQKAIDSEEMIDCDYWIQAQDFTTPVFDIKDVHATDEKSGYADIEIKVFGEDDSEGAVSRVQVKIENGEWKIDDFQYKDDNGKYRGWE
jgi:ABC-type transporter MlaC component